MSILYHDGNRQLQDRFDSRRISDRLEEKLTRTAFTADDKAFIEGAAYFFLATADAQGRPDCSFKGGHARLRAGDRRLRTGLPRLRRQRHVQEPRQPRRQSEYRLLFIALHDKPKRLRVNGSATVSDADPLLGETLGAQLIVRVQACAIFPNCPRYIPNLQMTGPSIYAPQPKCEPPEPSWKTFDSFKDAVHPRAPTFKG
jgi:hypothetical protein